MSLNPTEEWRVVPAMNGQSPIYEATTPLLSSKNGAFTTFEGTSNRIGATYSEGGHEEGVETETGADSDRGTEQVRAGVGAMALTVEHRHMSHTPGLAHAVPRSAGTAAAGGYSPSYGDRHQYHHQHNQDDDMASPAAGAGGESPFYSPEGMSAPVATTEFAQHQHHNDMYLASPVAGDLAALHHHRGTMGPIATPEIASESPIPATPHSSPIMDAWSPLNRRKTGTETCPGAPRKKPRTSRIQWPLPGQGAEEGDVSPSTPLRCARRLTFEEEESGSNSDSSSAGETWLTPREELGHPSPSLGVMRRRHQAALARVVHGGTLPPTPLDHAAPVGGFARSLSASSLSSASSFFSMSSDR